MENYKKAIEIIEQNSDISDFVGQCSETIIKLAEEKLGLRFSKMYFHFLANYGAGNFGSEEIYGIIDSDFENSSVPDAIWCTLKERKEINLPNNLVIIYDTGSEEIFCLDFNKLNKENEPAVVVFVLGVDLEYQTYEVIADDFGNFLLDRINEELGNM
ncbi:MAG: SMI1/KNR4 family protein [Halanaerobiales bacterium]|nr:SMI1/KNR4 family protein [Halanaerobiales bacterium]